ncbi:MAG: RNA polymerase sigma factor [Deltaproteobacteria bacterium]|nr:RNA polymerase sigma factor [Candidatus Zymogenaceae bacterium]
MTRQHLIDFWKAERYRLVHYVRGLISDAADRDSEDVVQDVLESVLRQFDLSQPIEDLSAYVYRALRNRVIDLFRKKRNMVSIDAALADDEELSLASLLADAAPDAFDELSGKETLIRIAAVMESLGDDEKAVVVETELHERTFKELAEEWGVPIGTLLSRKSRALAKIAGALADLEEEWEENNE